MLAPVVIVNGNSILEVADEDLETKPIQANPWNCGAGGNQKVRIFRHSWKRRLHNDKVHALMQYNNNH